MRSLRIGKTTLQLKDYECSIDGSYLPKPDLRLWLYVNVTGGCNAACPFCINPPKRLHQSIDVHTFSATLEQIESHVSGISITGGEPMLDVALLEDTIAAIEGIVSPSVQLDLVTNGMNLTRLPHLRGLSRLTTIHVSRHATSDEVNRRLMGWQDAPSTSELAKAFDCLPDPGATVLNCVLQKGGVHDLASAMEYLEMAASIGASNVSFIGMIRANPYCARNHVSPATLGFESGEKVSIWNHFHDHDFCQCSTGDYRARDGYIRFYYRYPGTSTPPSYCRQLVYGADNVLRQGFGNSPEIKL